MRGERKRVRGKRKRERGRERERVRERDSRREPTSVVLRQINKQKTNHECSQIRRQGLKYR